MTKLGWVGFTLACIGMFCGCSHSRAGTVYSWNSNAAAQYLDQREAKWESWPGAARDHGTFCVSCHTSLPYALFRLEIPSSASAQNASVEESRLIDNVRRRVRLWTEIGPYYQGKTDQSRGTEAVLNALILATYDARTGKFTADAQAALDHMWTLQETNGKNRGAWAWLEFQQEPWEAPDSVYYGACLAALAVGTAPGKYRNSAEVQSKMELLRKYLNQSYGAQTPMNRITLYWASLKWPGLIDAGKQQAIVKQIFQRQQQDGGWSSSTLVGEWKRTDGTPLVRKSDGYATGLIAYVLEEAGVPQNEEHLRRALTWLVENQSRWNGHWAAYSLNKRRHDPFSNVSQFMNDAATAYAAVALAEANGSPRNMLSGKLNRVSMPVAFDTAKPSLSRNHR